MKKQILAFFVVAVVVSLSGAAYAENSPASVKVMHTETLNKFRQQTADLREQLKVTDSELRGLYAHDSLDTWRVAELEEDIKRIKTKIKSAAVSMNLEPLQLSLDVIENIRGGAEWSPSTHVENEWNTGSQVTILEFKQKHSKGGRIMKTFVNLILVVVLASITGCAGNRDLIAKTSIASRQDVFQEVQTTQAVPGRAVLKVGFSIKNFKARFINTYYKHTDPPYTAILNIDGQTAVLSDDPVLEDLPGDFKNNPEVGTGWRYNFKKTLQLQPGKHHVSIAVPLSDVDQLKR